MSMPSEDPTDNALEALRALTRERVEPRLAAVGGTPVQRPAKLENRPDIMRPSALAAGDRLENAMSEFVRRQVKPEIMPEPVGLKREGMRSMLTAGAMGLAAIAAVAGVVALLFVTLFPKEKDPVQSFAAAAPAALPLNQPDDAAKPVASQQVRALGAKDGDSDSESISHEQSERLLQQFVQWRQKAALTDKP